MLQGLEGRERSAKLLALVQVAECRSIGGFGDAQGLGREAQQAVLQGVANYPIRGTRKDEPRVRWNRKLVQPKVGGACAIHQPIGLEVERDALEPEHGESVVEASRDQELVRNVRIPDAAHMTVEDEARAAAIRTGQRRSEGVHAGVVSEHRDAATGHDLVNQ